MSSKKRVNISLDSEVYAKAKRLGLNISGVAEHALRTYVQTLQHGDQSASSPAIATPAGSADNETPTHNVAQHAEASVEEILADYENYARTVLNRGDTTLDQHRRYIGRLLRHAEEPPHAITEADIIGYLESEQPMSDSKKNNILSALRVFFREYLDRDVADEFEMPTTGPSPTHVPTKDELQTFYAAIERPKYRTIFLMYATSGLRSAELVELTMEDINEDMRMLVPDKQSEVKKTWASFYNEEAEATFQAFKPHRDHGDERVFQASKPTVNKTFRDLSEESGVKITPQMLRRWFASEMSSLGVDATYIDAFCGRTPTSVLEEHYLDYSPRKLKQIYDNAGLTVLE